MRIIIVSRAGFSIENAFFHLPFYISLTSSYLRSPLQCTLNYPLLKMCITHIFSRMSWVSAYGEQKTFHFFGNHERAALFYFSESPAGLAALQHSGRMTPGSRRRQGQALCFPECSSAKGSLLFGVRWMLLLLLFLLAFTLAVKPDVFQQGDGCLGIDMYH